jgi:hypothetical protein
VHCLKKFPSGVTLDEAADAVKRQSFDPQKLVAYEAFGLTTQEAGRLKLAPRGWEMARQLEPEVAAFRALLDHLEPYRAVLQWAARQNIERLLQQDVANYWWEYFPEALGLSDERSLEGYVLCFFQLCQAAALGTHINGRKGQPSRLRVDSEELADYLAGETKKNRPRPELVPPLPTPLGQTQIFVSHQALPALAEQVTEALALADLAGLIAARGEDDFLPAATIQLMRRCAAGVFLLSGHDFQTDERLAPKTQILLGAAMALYDHRILLLRQEDIALPPALAQLPACAYAGDTLNWANGACLVKTIKEFVCA